ncbi:MAG TPA: hypothetical protein PLP17_12175, partial [Oligoflexia bacterium]|nr:hypothetical protein [Oligoflexia bacterium]
MKSGCFSFTHSSGRGTNFAASLRYVGFCWFVVSPEMRRFVVNGEKEQRCTVPIREDVLIVLNEREPLKHQMAAELELLLRAKHLAAQRLDLRPGVLETITKRTPCVLVLDYLLGDFGTALDILPALRAANSETQTRVILWTDEPSVYAAVEALKLGAVDYIKIDSSRSIQLVLQAIEKCLTAQA